jgi:K+-sensing histidine kinase KdpD
MKISQRLFLGVIPSLVGLFTVAGLAYWGEYAHSAPELVVAAAAVASLASLILAWRNTRYVVRRVEQLAAMRTSASGADELDAIQHAVESLGEEVSSAKANSLQITRDADRRVDEYARLISEASTGISTQLAEARLSLHVLQETHFGELNDNQEEMINAARTGVEAAEGELRNLRTIADIDRGQVEAERGFVKPGDLVRALLPLLKARGAKRNVRVLAEIEPGLPAIAADRSRLQDALGLVLNDAVTYAIPGATLSIHAAADKNSVTIVVNHGSPHSSTSDLMLAQRLIGAQGGSVSNEDVATVVTLSRDLSGTLDTNRSRRQN